MKTVNFELSKQLEEKGFPQDQCQYYWTELKGNKGLIDIISGGMPSVNIRPKFPIDGAWETAERIGRDVLFAAPTNDEVLELLPSEIKKDDSWYSIVISKTKVDYWIDYRYIDHGKIVHLYPYMFSPTSNSLADTAAEIFIYLKEQKLI
jgi:hypothetical protein